MVDHSSPPRPPLSTASLIARTHGLFTLAPEILHLVGIVGGVTLVLAGFAALVQTDIKRILAYSTMSWMRTACLAKSSMATRPVKVLSSTFESWWAARNAASRTRRRSSTFRPCRQ